MGKGDKKSKRGKIILGSHGVSRPKRKKSGRVVIAPTEPKAETAEVNQKAKASEPKAKTEETKPKAPKKTKSKEISESAPEDDVSTE
ncbi:MAG: 30S ribosomal protein THX [Bacteroidales bacterium]|nr:30S ribosomal protein THX [Bacteroidales bacterium]